MGRRAGGRAGVGDLLEVFFMGCHWGRPEHLHSHSLIKGFALDRHFETVG